MSENSMPGGDMWLLAVHPALTDDLVAWLRQRGLQLGRIPGLNIDEIDEPVWMTSPAFGDDAGV